MNRRHRKQNVSEQMISHQKLHIASETHSQKMKEENR